MTLRTSLIALALLVGCAGQDADYDGWTVEAGDCDDNDNLVYPGGNEICDSIDNDCSGVVDDGYASGGALVFYVDADGDGYGATTLTQLACSAPDGFVENASDCKDEGEGAADFNPRADELCDGEDQNCNGEVDDEAVDATAWHADWDQDGYGSSTLEVLACEAPEGYITDPSDCNDFDPFTNPAADEACDYTDNNCDGEVDESTAIDARTWYADADGDEYGDAESTTVACWLPSGYSALDTDCDDARGNVNPGLEEVCRDGLDNNCDDTANQCSFESWDSTDNATINWIGQNSSDYLGWDASFVGDIDGDGMDDIVAGMPYADPSSTNSGTAWLIYGHDDYEAASDPIAVTGNPGFNGTTLYNYAGYSVGPAGDVDGDGYDDFLIGAYGGNSYPNYYGNAVLVYGGSERLSGRTSMTSVGPTFRGQSRRDYFAGSVYGGFDLDGDGYDEFAIGGRGYSSYRGIVTLWEGGSERIDGSFTTSDADAYWTGTRSSAYLGSFAGALGSGDFDGDGNDDLLMAAYRAGSSYQGEAYLVYGDGSVPAGSQSLGDAVTFTGQDSFRYFAYSSQSLGDPNDDGYEDFGVGCYGCNSYGGGLYIYFGSSTQLSSGGQGDADASINNTDASSAYLGRDRMTYGDFNSDGIDDIVVGAYRDSAGSAQYEGALWVLAGSATLSGEYERDDVTQVIAGKDRYDYFGKSTSAGDFNGDGYTDLIGGAYGMSSYRGRLFLFEGTAL